MFVTLVSNSGEGTRRQVEVAPGTTLNDFVASQGFGDSSRFKVRVNRFEVNGNPVLEQGDTISVTPSKIAGALEVAIEIAKAEGDVALASGLETLLTY